MQLPHPHPFNDLPQKPEPAQFETDEDFQEALDSWRHRVAPIIRTRLANAPSKDSPQT